MTLILSGTDGLSDVDGSAATPAIRGTDANTGIFFGADIIGFAEGGAEAMRIDSSGNVGIGTSSPAKRLSVVNATDATTVGTNSVMTVQAGSSVNSVAEIGFSYGSWSGTNPIASLGYQITSNAGVGSGALTFSTRSVTTDTAPSERMRIDSSGNVGIGTSSPTGGRLHVVAPSGVSAARIAGASGANIVVDFTGGGDNYFDAGNNIFRNASGTERARIDSSGRLLVGQTSDNINAQLSVATSGNGFHAVTTAAGNVAGSFERNNVGILVNFRNNGSDISGAQIYNNTTSVSYATGSDYRLKHDIQPMTGALAKVAQLKPVTYKWNADDSESQGFIAHELQEVVPECVTGEKDAVETYLDEEGVEQTRPKYQGIDTSFLVATLTAAIQEQQALITTLTDRITALETPTGTQA
jgi:hypothetical protein